MEGSEIYKRKLKREIRCPLKYGLDIFGGKWKSRILCVLAAKEQLREEIGNITDPVFAPVESFPGSPAYTPTSSAASGRRMPGNSKKTGKSKKTDTATCRIRFFLPRRRFH